MERDYFPRGGAVEKPVIQYKKFVFEKKKSLKSKKKKTERTSRVSKPKNFIPFPKTQSAPHYHLKYSDIGPGFQCICAVHSIFEDRLLVNLPYEMRAYVHYSSVSSPYSKFLKSSGSAKDLSKMFYIGQLLSCKVIKKPSEDKGGRENVQLFVTTDPAAVNWNLNSGMIAEHSLIQMAVSSVEDRGYMMESGVAGVMAFLPVEQAYKYTKTVLAHKKQLTVGTILWCYVVKATSNSHGSNVVEVRISHDATFDLEASSPSSILRPGSRVNTTVTKVFNDGCCQVSVDGTHIHGNVNTQLDFNREPSENYLVGTSIKVTVMTFSPFADVYNFSSSHHVYKPMLSVDRSYKQVCLATVDHVSEFVIYLTLENKRFKGIIPIKSMLKKMEEERKEGNNDECQNTGDLGFKPGDSVKVEIANINFITRKYICSMIGKTDPDQYRKKKMSKKKNKKRSKMDYSSDYDDSSDFGIKLEPELDSKVGSNSKVKNEEMSSDNQNDSGIDTCKYPEKKKTKKEKKKGEKMKISKRDDTNSDNEIKQELDSDVEIKQEEDDIESYPNTKKGSKKSGLKDSSEEPKSFSDENTKGLSRKRKSIEESGSNEGSKKSKPDYKQESNPVLSDAIKKKVDAVALLSLHEVDSQFLWEATPEDLAKVVSKDMEEFKEESDEENVAKQPLSKKQKKANEIEKERKICEKEDELLKALEEPKSADHYERLILSRPDDSKVWIKYMAFHLEATEIEKARAVGNRALKLISHRSEQDRLNIWLALLNLEYLYGSKELFKETWTEALKCNDDYKINCKVLDMYAGSQNTVEVHSLVRRMVKQYRENIDCWYTCLSALMLATMEDKARDLLQRGLKSLPVKNHLTLISRFALLENRHGCREEAQALFDNLLTSYPTRVDIWFVYIDMLIKSDQKDLTRQVFERATSLKLPAKKMKSLYKKWLDFEEKYGNEEDVETVRKSAVQYVEQATKDIGK